MDPQFGHVVGRLSGIVFRQGPLPSDGLDDIDGRPVAAVGHFADVLQLSAGPSGHCRALSVPAPLQLGPNGLQEGRLLLGSVNQSIAVLEKELVNIFYLFLNFFKKK